MTYRQYLSYPKNGYHQKQESRWRMILAFTLFAPLTIPLLVLSIVGQLGAYIEQFAEAAEAKLIGNPIFAIMGFFRYRRDPEWRSKFVWDEYERSWYPAG